jgi:hypothetical protein
VTSVWAAICVAALAQTLMQSVPAYESSIAQQVTAPLRHWTSGPFADRIKYSKLTESITRPKSVSRAKEGFKQSN